MFGLFKRNRELQAEVERLTSVNERLMKSRDIYKEINNDASNILRETERQLEDMKKKYNELAESTILVDDVVEQAHALLSKVIKQRLD